MYENQFGLSRRPFPANAVGASVFVGPQTAKFMAGMRKGLATSEAVVVVTGKPGVGKSTLVNRAIDAISGDKFIIRLSRMQLGHDEVLDFLLDKLDASDIPASTMRKIPRTVSISASRFVCFCPVGFSVTDSRSSDEQVDQHVRQHGNKGPEPQVAIPHLARRV